MSVKGGSGRSYPVKKGFDFDHQCGKKNEEVDYPQYDFEGSTRSSSDVDQAVIGGLVGMINAVRPQLTILATDLGQVQNPPPAPVIRVILTHSDLRD